MLEDKTDHDNKILKEFLSEEKSKEIELRKTSELETKDSSVTYDYNNDRFFIAQTNTLNKNFSKEELKNANILELMRATNKERDEIINILKESSFNGQLDEKEFEYRTGLALESKTLKQLEILVQDLLTQKEKPEKIKQPENSISDKPNHEEIKKVDTIYTIIGFIFFTLLFLLVGYFIFSGGLKSTLVDIAYDTPLISKIEISDNYNDEGRLITVLPDNTVHGPKKYTVTFFKVEDNNKTEVKSFVKEIRGKKYSFRLPAGKYKMTTSRARDKTRYSFIVYPPDQIQEINVYDYNRLKYESSQYNKNSR